MDTNIKPGFTFQMTSIFWPSNKNRNGIKDEVPGPQLVGTHQVMEMATVLEDKPLTEFACTGIFWRRNTD